jgi:hypothetical protein
MERDSAINVAQSLKRHSLFLTTERVGRGNDRLVAQRTSGSSTIGIVLKQRGALAGRTRLSVGR